MRSSGYDHYFAAILVVAAFLFSACSTHTGIVSPTDETAPEVIRLLERLKDHNKFLKTHKGIGKLKVLRNGKLQVDNRVAWIGAEPSKLSVAVFVSGFPAIRVASDGEWFYYYDSQNRQDSYRKIRADATSLQYILAIPIKTADVVSLMAGRTPLQAYHAARLQKSENDSGWVLVLKKWWGVFQKIYLDESNESVRTIELFDRSGTLVYRAVFEQMQSVDGYQVPKQLQISNDDGAEFQLLVERYWADVSVDPSMFILEPPR